MNSLFSLMNYSEADRLTRIQALCSNLSFEQKMEMGAALGYLLSGIYDDKRVGGGPNASMLVSAEDQWQAMKSYYWNGQNDAKMGVCRDSASTIAKFFNDCGIPEKQIYIDSYTTASAGHQIVSVRDSNGKLYTVNWSELTSLDPSSSPLSQLPQPQSLYDVGIYQRRYNLQGKIIGMRETSLGSLMRVATQGTLDDPLVVPEILKFEAEWRGFYANGFSGRLQDGHQVHGAVLGYRNQVGNWFDYEAYVARAKRNTPGLPDSTINYGRFLFYVHPEIHAGQGLTFSPYAKFEGVGAITKAPSQNQLYRNQDGYLRLSPGLRVSKDFASGAQIHGSYQQNIGFEYFNNNQADKAAPAPYLQQRTLSAGVKFPRGFEAEAYQMKDAYNSSKGVQLRLNSETRGLQTNLTIAKYQYGPKGPVIAVGAQKRIENNKATVWVNGSYQYAFQDTSPQHSNFSVGVRITPKSLKKPSPLRRP